MKKRVLILLTLFLSGWLQSRADEGMWIPMLLEKYNIEDMQKEGFKLTAEDIYSINQASLKDAVIGLGRDGRPFFHSCSGGIVSEEGLVITNHHCAYGMIQSHSSLEHNYLRDGFWAKSLKDELANPGFTASVLVRMEDVTEKINSQLNEGMSREERSQAVSKISKQLEGEAVKGTNLQANIKPYFGGNQYFMSVFKIYRDVRLVGAPPSAIGKFGGDTDNWTWPRHTGDFAVIRIYADENNEPAPYSEKNKPYKPAKFFKVSAKGVNENDFTMVFGYPGTTNEYLTSYAIEQIINIENPHKVAIRTAKLNIINAAMESDEALRIKYAAKAAGVANAWKKWQGETMGMKRFNTIANKQELEKQFRNWAKDKPEYRELVDKYEKLYGDRKDLILASSYAAEAGMGGAEIIRFVLNVNSVVNITSDEAKLKENLTNLGDDFYKNYDSQTDCKILSEMLRLYNQLPQEWLPVEVSNVGKKEEYEKYTQALFEKSFFADKEKYKKFVESGVNGVQKKLEKDPAYILASSISDFQSEKISPELSVINREIAALNRFWMAGLMEMQPDKTFYPDANSTLRVAYGKVKGYTPKDAVYYKHYTTLQGIVEKDNPAIYDYDVPQKLRDLAKSRNFGEYLQDNKVPVCFVASNHTTGGNSGSPVLNAEGHFIGLNFDRAWEGVMSDLQYDPEICRNISVDVRYMLFIMDKFADAQNLINEMEIVK